MALLCLGLSSIARADSYIEFQTKRFYSANAEFSVEVKPDKRATLYRMNPRPEQIWSQVLPVLPSRLFVSKDGKPRCHNRAKFYREQKQVFESKGLLRTGIQVYRFDADSDFATDARGKAITFYGEYAKHLREQGRVEEAKKIEQRARELRRTQKSTK